jgi:hypothetical protein
MILHSSGVYGYASVVFLDAIRILVGSTDFAAYSVFSMPNCATASYWTSALEPIAIYPHCYEPIITMVLGVMARLQPMCDFHRSAYPARGDHPIDPFEQGVQHANMS